MKIVLFDGVCGLCNHSVSFLIKIDKDKRLKYTPLQGEFAKTLSLDPNIDSILFYDDGTLYYKSTAILKICARVGGVWRITSLFYIIPSFLRDRLYDMVAQYRYRLFGKTEQCSLPTKEQKELFLA